MEGLLAEINKKKAQDFAGGSKYVRRSELEKVREEEEAKKREERKRKADGDGARASKMRKEAEAARLASLRDVAESHANSPAPGSPAPDGEEEKKFSLPQEEVVRRLRARGEPIRLFGELDKDRRLRLRALELSEDRGGKDQVDFKRAMEDLKRREEEQRAQAGQKKEDRDLDKMAKYTAGGPLDLNLIKTDFNALHPLIYWHYKALLKEWDEWLEARPEEVKRTAAGKLAAANQVQSAQNLKPLFRGLKNRDLPEDVVEHLAEVVYNTQIRNYQKANDAYLRLSIGNAAWPLGVTSVGIHERSNDNKTVNSVAHVLNDEVSRKYIQAVKRLLTFSQMVRPPEVFAQNMG